MLHPTRPRGSLLHVSDCPPPPVIIAPSPVSASPLPPPHTHCCFCFCCPAATAAATPRCAAAACRLSCAAASGAAGPEAGGRGGWVRDGVERVEGGSVCVRVPMQPSRSRQVRCKSYIHSRTYHQHHDTRCMPATSLESFGESIPAFRTALSPRHTANPHSCSCTQSDPPLSRLSPTPPTPAPAAANTHMHTRICIYSSPVTSAVAAPVAAASEAGAITVLSSGGHCADKLLRQGAAAARTHRVR